MNIRIGRISKLFSPPYLGACFKCKTTWRFVKGHSTPINDREGIFPLCKKCWADLTPEKRAKYYEMLIKELKKDGYCVSREERAAIIAAVLAGK